jgi:hypothetical protein
MLKWTATVLTSLRIRHLSVHMLSSLCSLGLQQERGDVLQILLMWFNLFVSL